MRKWMRAHTGETCFRARQASKRGVYPSDPPLMVLGACGYCGVAHVLINVFPLDTDDVTVKPLLTAQRIRSDYESDTGYTSASCLWTSTARHAFLVWRWAGRFIQERFICCCCAFGHCAWFHPPEPETRELIQEAESPGNLKLERADSVNMEIPYRLMLWGKYTIHILSVSLFDRWYARIITPIVMMIW